MNLLVKIIVEVLAFVFCVCVLLPFYLVCLIIYMILGVLTLPLKIPEINRWVRNYLKREK
nr:MAG TPA: hypothetical protein [Caudoviricetes sp.]